MRVVSKSHNKGIPALVVSVDLLITWKIPWGRRPRDRCGRYSLDRRLVPRLLALNLFSYLFSTFILSWE